MNTFLKSLLGALVLCAVLLAGALYLVNRRASRAFEDFLRHRVFRDDKIAAFDTAAVQAWRGKVYVRGLRLDFHAPQGEWKAQVQEISAAVPVRALLSGRPTLSSLTLEKPQLEFIPGRASPEAGPESRAVSLPVVALRAAFELLPARGVSLEDGLFRLYDSSGASAFSLDHVAVQVGRLEGGGVSVRAQGRLASDRSSLTLEAKLQDPNSPCLDTEGQIRIDQFPVPALAKAFPPAEMRFLDGRISINTQFTCRKGWLTASHLVAIKDFSMEIPEGTKRILGIPVKRLKELLRIPELSFVVPMNGSAADPQIGITSSVQQILLRMLEGKLEDKAKAAALAKKGGDYFGGKIDQSLREWLKQKKR